MKEEKKLVVSNVSWTFAERLLTEIIAFIISIIMARLVMPEDYGVVALVSVFISILSIFVNNGLGASIVQKKDITVEQIATLFYVNFLFGLILYALLYFCAPLIANFYNNSELILIVRVLGIKLPISSIYSIQQAYVQRRMEFKKFFFSSLAGTIMCGIVGIFMAYKGYGVWALVVSGMVDLVMDSLILFCSTRWLPRFVLDIQGSQPLLKFGLGILGAELVSRGYEQVRLLVIGKAYTGTDLAYNSKGQKFPQVIIEVTNSTIMRVMFPTLSKMQDDKELMKSTSSNAIQVSIFLLAPAMVGLAAVAERFVPFLFTDKWNACIPFLQLYCFTYLFQPIHTMDLKIIQACGRSDISFKIEVIKKLSGLAFLALSVILFDNVIYVAASFTAMSMVALVVNSIPCKKLINYGLINQLKDILPSLLVSLAMGVVVYFVGKIQLSNLIVLIIQVVVGVLVYLLLSFIFRIKSLSFFTNYIKEFMEKRRAQ